MGWVLHAYCFFLVLLLFVLDALFGLLTYCFCVLLMLCLLLSPSLVFALSASATKLVDRQLAWVGCCMLTPPTSPPPRSAVLFVTPFSSTSSHLYPTCPQSTPGWGGQRRGFAKPRRRRIKGNAAAMLQRCRGNAAASPRQCGFAEPQRRRVKSNWSWKSSRLGRNTPGRIAVTSCFGNGVAMPRLRRGSAAASQSRGDTV